MAKAKLSPGRRATVRLAKEIQAKSVRLNNKARLVSHDGEPGRNLTALRNTAAEMIELLMRILEPRCRECGCTQDDCEQCVEKTGDACSWVGPDLCSACVSAVPKRGDQP